MSNSSRIEEPIQILNPWNSTSLKMFRHYSEDQPTVDVHEVI
jgi:hypothetical protein